MKNPLFSPKKGTPPQVNLYLTVVYAIRMITPWALLVRGHFLDFFKKNSDLWQRAYVQDLGIAFIECSAKDATNVEATCHWVPQKMTRTGVLELFFVFAMLYQDNVSCPGHLQMAWREWFCKQSFPWTQAAFQLMSTELIATSICIGCVCFPWVPPKHSQTDFSWAHRSCSQTDSLFFQDSSSQGKAKSKAVVHSDQLEAQVSFSRDMVAQIVLMWESWSRLNAFAWQQGFEKDTFRFLQSGSFRFLPLLRVLCLRFKEGTRKQLPRCWVRSRVVFHHLALSLSIQAGIPDSSGISLYCVSWENCLRIQSYIELFKATSNNL